MLSAILAAFTGLSTIFRLVTVGAVALPLLGLTHWVWGEWQYHEGRVFERSEVVRAEKRSAEEWAAWLVSKAVEDEEFAKAVEAARVVDAETKKEIDRETAKAPTVGVCLTAEFMRELDKLRP